MKKIGKKNQVIIAALTLMIACAGYLNFAGKDLDLNNKKKDTDTGSKSAFAEVDETGVYDENIKLNSDEDEIGEAVLTSTQTAENTIATARLNREQTRSKAKEEYLAIINDETLSDEAKKTAVESYTKLTGNMEKETAAENALHTSGFDASIVQITDSSVEITIDKATITDVEKTNIEDAVKNSTGCTIDMIVINMAGE